MIRNYEEFSLVGSERQGLATKIKGGVSKPRHSHKNGIGLNYLIDFLQFIQIEERANEVYKKSPYKFKAATIEMIRWCLERGVISKREEYKSKFKSRKRPMVFYHITDDGRELLRLIR